MTQESRSISGENCWEWSLLLVPGLILSKKAINFSNFLKMIITSFFLRNFIFRYENIYLLILCFEKRTRNKIWFLCSDVEQYIWNWTKLGQHLTWNNVSQKMLPASFSQKFPLSGCSRFVYMFTLVLGVVSNSIYNIFLKKSQHFF